ncbi:unnamed protein product (macronuclear) [Paramecium tetraurelia]|uniref:Uncharacterized protein n=1 Tax=Paramecium tetraurelia TaxID=5888 RepID=A0D877_PARTE|nr:uncharacterized protein GSPATT00014211001 [Paramecium tetraurelia]CAK79244.1 unnamed protein product [Paramecium tetraurelia]|eukprot:XP_001446641.1 hypothetical protein (macronuclear) [Paramecium tetraurelia strain d4-2]
MQDSEPRGRVSIGGKTDKFRMVKLSLSYKEKIDSTLYIRFINKTLNEEVYKVQEMKQEQQLYTIELILKENCIYKYYYDALDNTTKLKHTELGRRYFQFAETEKIQIDEWNKVWCLYRIRPKTDEIFKAYQIQVKNLQDGKYFELRKSAIVFPAKDFYENTGDSMSQEIIQFSLRSKIDEKEDLSSQIQIQNINKFKMNCFFIEIDLQLFPKQKQDQIKKFFIEWNFSQKIQILEEQIKERDKGIQELEQENGELKFKQKDKDQRLSELQIEIIKKDELHRKEINNLIYKYEQEKASLSILHCQETNNLTVEFDKKFKRLSDQVTEWNNQYNSIQQDFNQFQLNATKRIAEYIEKLQESQTTVQIQELQLIQFKNNNQNVVEDDSQINDKIFITLLDGDQKASKEEITQMNSLQETLKQYKDNLHELQIKNQEIESELSKKDRLQSAFKVKINEQIKKYNTCMLSLENTQNQLQDYIQKNEVLQQNNLHEVERYKKLQNVLEIIKGKYKDLQKYKEQYQELLDRYEKQTQQFVQLENQKRIDDMEFEKQITEKSNQIQSMACEYQKQITQTQQENQQLLENQHAEQLIRLKQKHDLFMQFSEGILENVLTEILKPYQVHQATFSRKLSSNLDSEIRNIKCLMLINFETAINIAADGINIITNNSFNNLKEDLINIHSQIIQQIQIYKENIDFSTMKCLLSLMNEFQQKIIEIKNFAYSVENMLQQDQDQIDLINNNCQTLEKILDIVIKLNSVLERKNDELTILLENQEIVIQAFEHFRQKSLSLIDSM